MLEAVANAGRAPTTCECGAPVAWGSHFCANCGRPVGAKAVVSCKECGHPLPADAGFCANCGHALETDEDDAEESERVPAAEQVPAADQASDETVIHSADPWEE